MKKNDQVTITKPGILNGQTGVITAIRYEVNLGAQGVHYLSDGEILPEKKDNAVHVIKTPNPDANYDIQKSVYAEVTAKAPKVKQAKKEVVTKRKYTRKTK